MMSLSVVLRRYVWVPWVLMAASILAVGLSMLVVPVPPLQFLGAAIRPPVVRVGDEATLTYHSIRDRSCPSIINKGWVDALGAVVLRLPQTTGGIGRLGEQRNSITVPVPAVPGLYCFRMVTHHDCSGGQEYDVAAPEACLQVIP